MNNLDGWETMKGGNWSEVLYESASERMRNTEFLAFAGYIHGCIHMTFVVRK